MLYREIIAESLNVVQGNNRCLFTDPHKTHKYTCGQNMEPLNVKPGGA